MRPHTHSRPKPLLRVRNKPVLAHVLDGLGELGVEDVICITGHLVGQIEEFLEAEYPQLEKHYVPQERQLGTADAIALAEEYVTGPVLIIFVDTLFDADFGVIERYAEADGIIWAKEVEDYQRFGVIVTDEHGYMQRIVEKPSEPVSKLANIGVYYIRNHELLFEGIRHVLNSDPNLGEYFLTDAFQYMIDHGAKLFTAEVEGWYDCGKVETVLDTNRVLLERGASEAPVGDNVTIHDPVFIDPDVMLTDSEIGPNVSIAAGSIVHGSRIRDSIVGSDSRLVSCELHDSMIGDHATLMGVRGSANVGDHAEIRE